MKRVAALTALCAGWVMWNGAGSTSAADRDPFCPPAITTENVPVVPPELIERLTQYQNTRSATFRGWSPDGKGMLISTRFGDTVQLHRVYDPSGRREQITFFREPVDGSFIPAAKDGSILITMSQGGNENTQVLLLDRQTGRATLLTDGKSRNLLEAVSKDGSRMIIGHNGRNGRDTDLYVADPRRPGSLKLLLETTNEFWTAPDWSHNGKLLLLNRYVSINETYPALLDVASGQKRAFPILDGKASFGSLAFAHDDRAAFVATDLRGEFQQLARLDVATSEFQWLADEIKWDVGDITVDKRSGTIAFTANEDGASALYLLKPQPGSKPRRLNVPLGIVSGLEFSTDGSQLGFSLARADAPGDAYSLAIANGELTRWTFSEVGGLTPETFVTPKRFRFRSFDDREIPAYIYKPCNASPSHRVAVLINIHGGPEAQSRPMFVGTDQFYVNELGIAVVYPNVRGSAGYGKTYLQLDNAEKREDSVRDIGGLLDWIAKQPDLDASRVAVLGGSYGGYMVLASATNFGERIKATIDVVGIANFNTFLKNTSAYRQDLRRAEYGDERDPKMLAVFEKISPANNADKIRSALMVIHGKNDPRVPFSEAEQIAAKVRANGRTVWTVYADNEGHGFAKKANRDYQSAAVAMFLREHLK
jgi:dipeptidyl aminopeptidase/acylaminoacyl peptidase